MIKLCLNHLWSWPAGSVFFSYPGLRSACHSCFPYLSYLRNLTLFFYGTSVPPWADGAGSVGCTYPASSLTYFPSSTNEWSSVCLLRPQLGWCSSSGWGIVFSFLIRSRARCMAEFSMWRSLCNCAPISKLTEGMSALFFYGCMISLWSRYSNLWIKIDKTAN